MLEQYKISDFIQWHREKALKLQPDFQRGSVWTPVARSYLVDTILREFPIPKIYMRSRIEVETKKTLREVVDGQQRLRAILDFAENKMQVNMRTSDFHGKTYDTLSEEFKEKFLIYPLAVDQLVNADDATVLEVFARLNAYTVILNGQETRHAKFQGEFKAAVRDMSQKWDGLMSNVFSTRKRVRMENDSLVAEMFGIVMDGFQEGGQAVINKMYQRHDIQSAPEGLRRNAIKVIDSVLDFAQSNLKADFVGTPLMKPPHFLMLFAALAHCGHGILKGRLQTLPDSPKKFPECTPTVMDQLRCLASAIEQDPGYGDDLHEFWKASSQTTHRMSSREVRFYAFLKAFNV